jgi:hypothetical protein
VEAARRRYAEISEEGEAFRLRKQRVERVSTRTSKIERTQRSELDHVHVLSSFIRAGTVEAR